VLLAAADWSVPPWEIAGGKKLLWLFRWRELKTQIAKARQNG